MDTVMDFQPHPHLKKIRQFCLVVLMHLGPLRPNQIKCKETSENSPRNFEEVGRPKSITHKIACIRP